MLEETIETMCDQINENSQLAAEVDKYVIGLGGDALSFAKAVWDISMILAAVVFAIVACFELYNIAVRTEARGGPMGSAEVVFKLLLKVAVCLIPLATFPSQELSQIGKGFLKQFVAVGLQGTLTYLVVRFLPAMIATALETNLFVSGDSITGALAVGALYSLAILITLMGTQQLSRRICGAM